LGERIGCNGRRGYVTCGRGDDLVEHGAMVCHFANLLVQAQPFGCQRLAESSRGGVSRTAVHIAHARQQRCDRSAVQTRGEQFLDVEHPVDGRLAVLALSAGGPIGNQHALLLVVTQRTLTHACTPRQLTNAHEPVIPVD
jgi:hypothetical protein